MQGSSESVKNKKFEVGEKVFYRGGEEFKKNELLVIIDIDDSRIPYLCENKQGKSHWLYFEDIRLADDGWKRCEVCNKVKRRGQFATNAFTKDRKRPYCVDCNGVED